MAYNFEVLFIQRMVMKRYFRRDWATTKVFVLARYEVRYRTANVTLITVITSVFVHNIGFQIGKNFIFIEKKITSFFALKTRRIFSV